LLFFKITLFGVEVGSLPSLNRLEEKGWSQENLQAFILKYAILCYFMLFFVTLFSR
jgi:hypothetical protein